MHVPVFGCVQQLGKPDCTTRRSLWGFLLLFVVSTTTITALFCTGSALEGSFASFRSAFYAAVCSTSYTIMWLVGHSRRRCRVCLAAPAVLALVYCCSQYVCHKRLHGKVQQLRTGVPVHLNLKGVQFSLLSLIHI